MILRTLLGRRASADHYRSQMNAAEARLRSQREEQRNGEQQLQKFKEQVAELQQTLPQDRTILADYKKMQSSLAEQLTEIAKKLQPLYEKIKEEKKYTDTVQEAKEWWHAAKHKPRSNFLLALYIVQHFEPAYYRLQLKKDYAFEGLMEVYFW